jgi:hypothetical protein
MPGKLIGKNAGFALTGFVAGIILMLALGFAKGPNKGEKEILPRNSFGDLRIVTAPLERSDAVNAAMVIYKGDIAILTLLRNDSNEVDGFGVTNGENNLLAFGRFARSGISEFYVYGNEVHDGPRAPVLFLTPSDKPGVWHPARYAPTVAPVYDEKGKLVRWRAIGEVYFDLDFDGQFDAKEILNDKSVAVSQSIFIKDQSRELVNLDRKERIGGFDPETQTADTRERGSKKTTYFDFVGGKGWQERSEKPGETAQATDNPEEKSQ